MFIIGKTIVKVCLYKFKLLYKPAVLFVPLIRKYLIVITIIRVNYNSIHYIAI